MLQRLKAERREDLRSFILSVVEKLLPSPKDLRELAHLVNIDRLRSIDDAETIAADFKRIETSLLHWADVTEMLSGERGKK
jgi:hypothetical protein